MEIFDVLCREGKYRELQQIWKPRSYIYVAINRWETTLS